MNVFVRRFPIWKARLIDFFESPSDPAPLGFFRLLIAAFGLVQLLLWYQDWMSFFSPEGWIQWEISRALNQDWGLHLQVIHGWLEPYGISGEQSVWLLYWVYFAALWGLLLGIVTRFWAILAWLCHFILMSTIPTFVYGVDIFLHIALFYLMVMPVSRAFSLDRALGWVSGKPSWGITLSLRVLQIHMCLAYLSAGYEKMGSLEWWDGNVLWRSMVQPDFRQYDLTWLANYPWIPMLLSWLTMTVETFYCLGMWIPRLRIFWLLGIVSLHLGIGMFLGLWLFGTIMILLSLSAFGFDAWRDLQNLRKKPENG